MPSRRAGPGSNTDSIGMDIAPRHASPNLTLTMNKLERIMAAIDRFLWQQTVRGRISYLSDSNDLIDLERRMRQVDTPRSPFPYY
jgi:hypothetical protein